MKGRGYQSGFGHTKAKKKKSCKNNEEGEAKCCKFLVDSDWMIMLVNCRSLRASQSY